MKKKNFTRLLIPAIAAAALSVQVLQATTVIDANFVPATTQTDNSVCVANIGAPNSIIITGAGDFLIQDSVVDWTAYTTLSLWGNDDHVTVKSVNSTTQLKVAALYIALSASSASVTSTLTVSGSSTSLISSGVITMGSYGNFSIENGAKVSATSVSFYRNGNLHVTGGSLLSLSGDLKIPATKSNNYDTITVDDGSLLVIGGTYSKNTKVTENHNFLQLNDGFIAFAGDVNATVEGYLTGGYVQYEEDGAWRTVGADEISDYFKIEYIDTLAEALDYGISNASDVNWTTGYTVLMSASAVPEPSTVAMLAGALLLTGARMMRRRRSL